MSVSLDLSDETLARLEAEAQRRDVSVESLIADFASGLSIDPLEDFIGCGESGNTDALDINAQRKRLAAHVGDVFMTGSTR